MSYNQKNCTGGKMMNKKKMIGIVGGVGPYAGLDLCKKILDQTVVSSDQDHLPIALLSLPGEICDRTDFILGKTKLNPAFAIVEIIKKLESVGAEVVAIACNTSHAPQIYDVICSELCRRKINIKLLNIINEVINYIKINYPNIKNIGVMSTIGCYMAKVYENPLKEAGYNAIIPDDDIQKAIHRAIYDREHGIKVKSCPIDRIAVEYLREAVRHLKYKGSDAIILGCTEISLSINSNITDDVNIIDSNEVLASALIREISESNSLSRFNLVDVLSKT